MRVVCAQDGIKSSVINSCENVIKITQNRNDIKYATQIVIQISKEYYS